MEKHQYQTLYGRFFGILLLCIAAFPDAVRGSPSQGAPLYVVSGPWHDIEQEVLAAGGYLIGPTQALTGSIAISDDPLFEERLHGKGVWIVGATPLVDLLCNRG